MASIMANPRLDFFRFSLKHKSEQVKTFRDFMIENGKCTSRQKDITIFGALYKYFMEAPTKDFATNPSLKKVMTVIPNPKGRTINSHYDKRPLLHYPDCIISGVVNGGPYGKERILTELSKKDSAGKLTKSQPVLQYYYIFAYLPLDHSEGFLMVHSDSSEESITQFLRNYVSSIFKLGEYQKPVMTAFAPSKFQNEYKNGATISSFSFKKTIVDNQIENDDPIKEIVNDFDVNITVSPKGEKPSLGLAARLKEYFNSKIFGNQNNHYRLEEFDRCTLHTRNSDTNSTKQFEWNDRDMNLVPVVYLKDRVKILDDGTPEFIELDEFCQKLFKEDILPELRPDKNVERVD